MASQHQLQQDPWGFLPKHVREQLSTAPLFSPTTATTFPQQQHGKDPSQSIALPPHHHSTVATTRHVRHVSASNEADKENMPFVWKSPVAAATAPFSSTPFNSEDDDNDEDDDTSDVFFTPKTTMTGMQSTANTPFSFITRSTAIPTSSSTYRTLPTIEMLSLDYIQECSCQSTLQHIVTVLTADSNKYPSLLRMAKARLSLLQQQQQMRSPFRRTASSLSSSPNTLELSISMDENTTRLDGLHDFLDSSSNSTPPPMLQIITPTEEESYNANIFSSGTKSTAASENVFDKQQQQQPALLQREVELTQEIERLTVKVKNVEATRLEEQSVFWTKMKELEESKSKFQQTVESLQKDTQASQTERRLLVARLEELDSEKRRLHENLVAAQQERQRTERQARDLEVRLTQKIQDLTNELARTKGEDSGLQRKNYELKNLLRSARRHLDDIKRERDSMLQAMASSTGKKVPDVNKLTLDERRKLIVSFATYTTSAKTAVQVMADTLREAQRNERKAVRAYSDTKVLLKQACQKYHRLEDDKVYLTNQIGQLSQELSDSRAYTEQILQSTQHRSYQDWQLREEKYKNIISKLRKQVCMDANQVSIDLYRQALASAQDKEAEADGHRRQSDMLSAEVAHLREQLQLKQKQTSEAIRSLSFPTPPSTSVYTGEKVSPLLGFDETEEAMRLDFASDCNRKVSFAATPCSTSTLIRPKKIYPKSPATHQNLPVKKPTGVSIRNDTGRIVPLDSSQSRQPTTDVKYLTVTTKASSSVGDENVDLTTPIYAHSRKQVTFADTPASIKSARRAKLLRQLGGVKCLKEHLKRSRSSTPLKDKN